MEIKRNDPCPCGSRKKYKKCCQSKHNQLQLQQASQERFFDLKHQMVFLISNFIYSKVTLKEQLILETKFRERINSKISKGIIDSFFKFWFLFFHEFENKKRGVEWFYEVEGKSLPPELREIAHRWTTLAPALIQAVNYNENGMTAQNFSTNKTIFMPYSDTLQEVKPWQVTFGLVEPFDNGYFFNGVFSWATPQALDEIGNEINRLQSETGKSFNQVAMEFYPELLSILLKNIRVSGSSGSGSTTQVVKETLTYTLHNKDRIIDQLLNSKDFVVEENEQDITWVGDWYKYSDNVLEDPIYLADSYGDITVRDGELTFESIYPEKVSIFEEWGKQFSNDMILKSRDQIVRNVPGSISLLNSYVLMPNTTPKYLPFYAKSRLELNNLDLSNPHFDGLSPREMAESGRIAELERWIQQHEFISYQMARQVAETIEYTADYNWIRKELGLPLSPFVSHYETRETSISLTTSPKTVVKMNEHEVPYYKLLGFTLKTAKEFYGQDIVDFFIEKTDGKTKRTIDKYTNGMSYLVNYFSTLEEGISSWKECSLESLEQLISSQLLDANEQLSNTQKKDVQSTIKAFFRWINKKYK
ncbi:SEC-C domain-containing protein [Niallia sp. XMNu-256]|uniref:SEC-C domain-containing protein n=1 Tax=Niallia sp. XMNu-256 TaxID=3082444 RepID=UPI0030D4B6A3